MLSCFGYGVGFDVWRWDAGLAPLPAPEPTAKRSRAPVKQLVKRAATAPAAVEIVTN